MRIVTSSGHTILADDADYQLLFQYTWHAKRAPGGRFYAWTNKPGDYTPVRRHMSMHRLLTNPPAGMVVHHKNNNGLDNRRSNLQVTTPRVNTRHAFRSGSAHLQNGRWRSVVRDESGKRISLGMYDTEERALAVVQNWNYRKMLELEEAGSMEAHHLAEVISNSLTNET